jgi:hypothetical protein
MSVTDLYLNWEPSIIPGIWLTLLTSQRSVTSILVKLSAVASVSRSYKSPQTPRLPPAGIVARLWRGTRFRLGLPSQRLIPMAGTVATPTGDRMRQYWSPKSQQGLSYMISGSASRFTNVPYFFGTAKAAP